MTEPQPRTGRVAFRSQGPLSVALEMLDASADAAVAEQRRSARGHRREDRQSVDGFVSARAGARAARRSVEGKTRISEGRLGHGLRPYEVHGANIAIDMTATAAEAKG